MRACLLVALGLCVVLPACEKTKGESPSKPTTLTWQHREDALAAAVSANKPALLDITAAWCQPCVEYDRVTFVDPAVIKALDGWVVVRLDVTRQDERHRAIQERYQAGSLPAVILFDESGTEAQRFDRFLAPAEFVSELERLATRAK